MLDLDTAFWVDGSYQAKRPAADVAAILEAWHAKDRWVVEGVYGDLVEPFLHRAEMLVWLALPWVDCSKALLDRELERRPIRTPELEKTFEALIAYGAAYDSRTNSISRTGHQRLFDGFAGKKVLLESRTEVDRWNATHRTYP